MPATCSIAVQFDAACTKFMSAAATTHVKAMNLMAPFQTGERIEALENTQIKAAELAGSWV
jgi:hypothetical protein